ncbi:hypothetical protein B9Z19DRAFT_1197535 [Tuber borchii]|uniref:Uncharacterized protein n=1 Tax=Tuber borchii TaxID=42251 RepID=A0A2T6ZAF6_TUBBO|nr:hypothetical protein B9Z19DRAFT_1197535 [Tuber borchii]
MESNHQMSKMQNVSNNRPGSGTTPPFSVASLLSLYPPGDARASEIASILQSLELGRLLYQSRRRNSSVVGSDHAEKLTAPASSLHTTQPTARVPFPLPTPPAFSAAPPLPVQPSVRTPFPLPAHPGHFPSSQSSSSLTSSTPQRGSFCTTSHLSPLIASVVPEAQRMSGCDTASVVGSRVLPSSPCCPNSLANNPASARSHGVDAVLRSRSDQGVKRKRGRKGKKIRNQKGDRQPLDQNSGQGKPKRQRKRSKRNPGGDQQKGKSGEGV